MKSNEDRLEDLRQNTSRLLSEVRNLDEPPSELSELIEYATEVCNDFIQLDISLLEGGPLPGAWGSSKMSKSKMQ